MRSSATPEPGPHASPEPGPHASPEPGPHASPEPGPHASPEPGPHASLDAPRGRAPGHEIAQVRGLRSRLTIRGLRSRPRKGRRLRDRRGFRIAAVVLAVFLCLVGWSVGNALTMPGGGTIAERLAEWARDHDLGPVVTFGEWLTYQAPKKGGRPSFALTGPSAAAFPIRPKGTHQGKARVVFDPPRRLSSPAWHTASRRGQVAGPGHRERVAGGLRNLPAAGQRAHLVRGGDRLDEPEAGDLPATSGV